ncbi:MAG TPA: lysylphosphatidylglycerol synthase transmembrane domain-containing protein [Candidatus Polarisedimenticolia bacterium]|nr:lysylphosphatidylglycerol synthase transmembrane domain-containing protein [Candidatus Polarisedimenticolia bacterium]
MTQPKGQSRFPKWVRAAWLPGALLLAALIAVALHYGESARFTEMLTRAEPIWLLVAAVLQLGTYFCTALILKLGLRHSGTSIRMRSLVPLGLVKLFIDQVVPTGGIAGTVLVIRALERRGVPVGLSTAAVVVSLLGFYLAYAISVVLCLVILWWRAHLSPVVLSAVSIMSAITAVIPVTLLWLTRGGAREVPHWIRRFPGLTPVLEAFEKAPREILHDRKLLLAASALQFAIFLLDAATLRAMLLGLGHSVPPTVAFASFILASAVATVSLLPGGVGPFEAGSVGTLRVLGVPLEAAVAATLLLRGFTLWLPMLPGLWLARREMVKQSQ